MGWLARLHDGQQQEPESACVEFSMDI
jgi:DNA-binding CsgD family transcriptional regulator